MSQPSVIAARLRHNADTERALRPTIQASHDLADLLEQAAGELDRLQAIDDGVDRDPES